MRIVGSQNSCTFSQIDDRRTQAQKRPILRIGLFCALENSVSALLLGEAGGPTHLGAAGGRRLPEDRYMK